MTVVHLRQAPRCWTRHLEACCGASRCRDGDLRSGRVHRHDNTLRNARLQGVAHRVEVHTADITDLPFDDNGVNVVVNNLVVHKPQ